MNLLILTLLLVPGTPQDEPVKPPVAFESEPIEEEAGTSKELQFDKPDEGESEPGASKRNVPFDAPDKKDVGEPAPRPKPPVKKAPVKPEDPETPEPLPEITRETPPPAETAPEKGEPERRRVFPWILVLLALAGIGISWWALRKRA